VGRVNLVALLHALSGAAGLEVSLYTEATLLGSAKLMKPLGFVVFAGGMLLFIVCVIYLKRAFLGDVEPVTDRLIATGPYRWVRHPLYLSMLLVTVGLAVALRSLLGLVIILFVFIPAGLWRARLEEQALGRRFGQEWEDYAAKTFLILPLVY
jgi:protein-S-isoprenylcysteine O-methyltransferase Ste14